MQTDIQARGFTLTQALLNAAQSEVAAYRASFPHTVAAVSIRLYDTNGVRGGPDKGCLACAHIGKQHIAVVASDVDSDLYTAIHRAFAKLTRATRSALSRARALRRKPHPSQIKSAAIAARARTEQAAGEALGG